MKNDHDALVLKKLSHHFGAEAAHIWKDTSGPPRGQVSCALFAAKDTGRPCHTLATIGMSRRKMVLDERAVDSDTVRAELIAYVKPAKSLPDDLADWMQWVGRFPFEQDTPTFLGWGHTIPIGTPVFTRSKLTTFFTIPPIVNVDQGTIFKVGKDPVPFLWLTFLTTAEYALKKSQGENAILDLFDQHRHPYVLDRKRKSYV